MERISSEEKQEVIDMWLSGKYFNVEIAAWVGISISSVRRILKEYRYGNEKKTNKL